MPPIVKKLTLYCMTLTININTQGNIELYYFGANVIKATSYYDRE